MTQTQINEYLEKAEKITRKAVVSQSAARSLLIKAGFCTKSGNLTKTYRSK
jgi:hypothetical protein